MEKNGLVTSYTMSKVFIDTNVLVYLFDKNEDVKKSQSVRLLQKFKTDTKERAVISTQILQEFYVSCVKKLKIDPLIVKRYITQLENFEIVQITPALINSAIDKSILNQLSFWDSLVIAAAETAKCKILLTEDLNHGQKIQGIKIENPFT